MNTGHFLAAVRYTMLAGAVYDAAVAIAILAAPELLARILDLPMPAEQIFLRFIGVFLLALALFYMLPVLHAGRYLGNVVVAAAARTMGGIFLIAAVAGFGEPRAYLLLGAIDLGFGGIHYLSLVPFNGFKVWQLAGADLAPRGRSGGRR